METPVRHFERILAALEELAIQEEQLLQAEDYAALVTLQARAAPLVERLTEYTGPTDANLRQRLTALVGRRGKGAELLARKLNLTRVELSRIEASQRRVSQVGPIYRDSAGASRARRLHASG